MFQTVRLVFIQHNLWSALAATAFFASDKWNFSKFPSPSFNNRSCSLTEEHNWQRRQNVAIRHRRSEQASTVNCEQPVSAVDVLYGCLLVSGKEPFWSTDHRTALHWRASNANWQDVCFVQTAKELQPVTTFPSRPVGVTRTGCPRNGSAIITTADV